MQRRTAVSLLTWMHPGPQVPHKQVPHRHHDPGPGPPVWPRPKLQGGAARAGSWAAPINALLSPPPPRPFVPQVRVARFQRETVHACVEVIQACGLDAATLVRPEHVTRRISPSACAPLDVLYPHLAVQQGELLQGRGPPDLLALWQGARVGKQ